MNRHDLFPAAARYFDLMDGAGGTTLADVFEPDAVLLDDGRTYTGLSEIGRWLAGPAAEFTTTSTWLAVTRAAGSAVAIIRVAGDFPGSPVELRHAFTEAPGGRVGALTITA